jgi:hypothetical protein
MMYKNSVEGGYVLFTGETHNGTETAAKNRMRTIFYAFLCAVIAGVCFVEPNDAFAQPKDAAKKLPAKAAPAKIEEKKELKLVNDTKASGAAISGSAWSEVSILASGGYFLPGSEQADYLEPSWSAKLIIQKNNIGETLFGGGIDISYAKLKDKEVPDGQMTYATLLPNATATFSLFDIVNAQIKGGPGLSGIYSKAKGKDEFSLSFTLGAGAGLFRIFGRHFVLGFEAAYWYYFQMHAASAMGVYGYTGYYF